MSWDRLFAGALRWVRNSASGASAVKVMQSIGQMSTQASHSMHSERGEHRLDIAVEAALGLFQRETIVEAELDLGPDVLERHHLVAHRHPEPLIGRNLVVVAPLVDAHLLAHDVHGRQRAHCDILAR